MPLSVFPCLNPHLFCTTVPHWGSTDFYYHRICLWNLSREGLELQTFRGRSRHLSAEASVDSVQNRWWLTGADYLVEVSASKQMAFFPIWKCPLDLALGLPVL